MKICNFRRSIPYNVFKRLGEPVPNLPILWSYLAFWVIKLHSKVSKRPSRNELIELFQIYYRGWSPGLSIFRCIYPNHYIGWPHSYIEPWNGIWLPFYCSSWSRQTFALCRSYWCFVNQNGNFWWSWSRAWKCYFNKEWIRCNASRGTWSHHCRKENSLPLPIRWELTWYRKI